MSVLITDAKRLNLEVTAVLKTYASNGARLHVAAVSAMVNAAMESGGNPAVLNRIFSGLRTNDRQALRSYLRRVHIAIGLGTETIEDGLAAEIYEAAVTKGTVFSFSVKKGQDTGQWFSIVKSSMENRKALCSLAETRLATPDGKEWMGFLDRNNFSEIKKFGDDDVLKGLKQLASKQDSEKVDASVTSEMSAFLTSIISQAEVIASKQASTVH